MPNMPRCIVPAIILIVASLLSGCGEGSKVETVRYIYASTDDCTDGGKVSGENCNKATELALVEHDTTAPKYATLGDCETTEGRDRCERFAERHYRPRLMGYLFTVNKTAVANPLYSGLKGATVFRDAGGTVYDHERTAGITFSKLAIRKAEGFVPSKRKG